MPRVGHFSQPAISAGSKYLESAKDSVPFLCLENEVPFGTMNFQSEDQLVEHLVAELEGLRPWGLRDLVREFSYGAGRADVVGVLESGGVIAIEAKLERWKEALHQAYRNTCFTNHSYVLLPWAAAQRASSFLGEFERRGVGLCTAADEEIRILFEPPRREPLQPWLAARAVLACASKAVPPLPVF